MNTLHAFENGSERFPRWDEGVVESTVPSFCGPNETEVGFLLPQLISTPGCPSRSRAMEISAALVRLFDLIIQSNRGYFLVTNPVKVGRAVVKAISQWLKARVAVTTQSASDLSRPPLAIPDEAERAR